MWVWIVIGVGSFLGLSLLVVFALAAKSQSCTIGRCCRRLAPRKKRRSSSPKSRRRPRASVG